MSLEHYKTQVLLLHSKQSTLDALSTGFNDRYAVHCATSGTEALNTLGDTPIHVIVSAQDLPGMSGLEALREAKKRSPDTIAILLAGTDASDGLEALVSEKEVFQIVRGEITPDAIKELIDSATKSARLLALSESANDTSANVDEPVAEHIVMETAANGSVIISDGTGTMPVLKPEKVQVSPTPGGQQVDVLVLTKDEEFLVTIKESSRGMHNVHHAVTPSQAEDFVRKNAVGVLVTDAAMVGSNIEGLTERLRKSAPRLVAIVAGRRDDGELLMDLINRGHVYRFLLKPVSPGRARLAIEASVKHHLEAADTAFTGKPRTAASPVLKPKPAPKPKPEPAAAPRRAPAPAAKAAPAKRAPAKKKPPQPPAKPTRAKTPAPPQARPTLQRKEPKISAPAAPAAPGARTPPNIEPMRAAARNEASPLSDGLDDAFDESNSFTETMTGLAVSVGKSLSGAAESIKKVAKSSDDAPEAAPSTGVVSLFKNPKLLGAAGGLLVLLVAAAWMLGGDGSDVEPEPTTAGETEPVDRMPSITETPPPAEPEAVVEAPLTSPTYEETLRQARDARANGDIYSPAGRNAVEFYLAAREAAPDDAQIAAEFDGLVEEVYGMAERALLENRYTDASRALRVIGLADAGNPRLAFLNTQLSQQQLREYLDGARVAIRERRFEDAGRLLAQAESSGGSTAEIDALSAELSAARSAQRLDEVLALASQRLDENNLTTPANDNARYYFELALNIDAGSTAAKQGLISVASKLVLGAREAIDDGNFAVAESLLGDARALDPRSADLAASTAALATARERQAAAEQAAAERAAAEREAEAERQAAEQAAAEREAEAERQAAEREAEARRQAAEQAAAEREAEARANAGAADTGEQPADDPPSSGDSESSAGGAAAQTAMAAATRAGAGADTANASRPNEVVAISALKRINYVAPRYPRSAQRRNVTGYVDLVFTVNADGTVGEVEVTESKPGTTFDSAAVEAVEKWRFEPVIENGRAVEKRAAVRMSFSLQ